MKAFPKERTFYLSFKIIQTGGTYWFPTCARPEAKLALWTQQSCRGGEGGAGAGSSESSKYWAGQKVRSFFPVRWL